MAVIISIHYFCLSLAAIPGYFIPLPRNTAVVTGKVVEQLRPLDRFDLYCTIRPHAMKTTTSA